MKRHRSVIGLLASAFVWAPVQLSAAAPGIVSQPEGRTVLEGSDIELRVGATNEGPLAYQWFRSFSKLNGETNDTLVRSNIFLDMGGDYRVVVTNTFGATTSSVAPVTVLRYLPGPEVNAAPGARASFSVVKVGRPIELRWFKDGQTVKPTYTLGVDYLESLFQIANVDESSGGRYCVAATNLWGLVEPPCSQLTIAPPGPLDVTRPLGNLPGGQYINLERHNGLYLALGAYQIATSTNAVDWRVTSGFPNLFYDVAWGAGLYVAVGENSKLYTSPDGLTWAPGSISAFGQLRSVAFGSGVFVVVAQQEVFVSTDGVSWLKTPAPLDLFQDVAWGAGAFVVASANGRVLTSTNGFDWMLRVTDPAGYLYSVAFGNDRFVALGSDGLAMTSENGTAWTARNSGTSEWFSQVVFEGGLFLGVTRSGSVLSSSDGTSWTIRSRRTNSAGLLCPANGTFLVVGMNNMLFETDPFATFQLQGPPNPRLTIQGGIGRIHQIESCDLLVSGTFWKTREKLSLPASPFVWTDSEPASSQRFYRVTVER